MAASSSARSRFASAACAAVVAASSAVLAASNSLCEISPASKPSSAATQLPVWQTRAGPERVPFPTGSLSSTGFRVELRDHPDFEKALAGRRALLRFSSAIWIRAGSRSGAIPGVEDWGPRLGTSWINNGGSISSGSLGSWGNSSCASRDAVRKTLSGNRPDPHHHVRLSKQFALG